MTVGTGTRATSQQPARVLTSESVTDGHPDKVCDYIADSILDAFIGGDKESRVACEVLSKGNMVVVAGEITSRFSVDVESVVRTAVREVGYIDTDEAFAADTLIVQQFLTTQAPEIAAAVRGPGSLAEQGAGDQGMMFGYATDETPELMPLPILLAHRIAERLAADRKSRSVPWLRPDAKTQVTVRYDGDRAVEVTDIVVSTQHLPSVTQTTIRGYVVEEVVPAVLGDWHQPGIDVRVNPSGSFVHGGPEADCGVTGRKIIVDTYGGAARHGGGAFSGKDPSKVDRSAAYFARYVARQIVKTGLAKRAELQVAYAIGCAKPVSLMVNTFGTGDDVVAKRFAARFDFRPAAIIDQLSLLRPIYRDTTNYGHFGKPGLPWEH